MSMDDAQTDAPLETIVEQLLKAGDLTRSLPLNVHGVRRCRGHWHVTFGGEDLAIEGDPFKTLESALDMADALNAKPKEAALASPRVPESTPAKRVYISGPMTGYPEFNYPAFAERAKAWRAAGWTVLNPAENFGGDQKRTYAEYMRKDIEDVLSVEAIALLPGYEQSKGAQLELSIAKVLGLALYDAMTFEPLVEVPASPSPDWRDSEAVMQKFRALRLDDTISDELELAELLDAVQSHARPSKGE